MIKILFSLLAFGIGSVFVYDSLVVSSLIDDIFEKQTLIIENQIEYPTEFASPEEFQEFNNKTALEILKATQSLNSHFVLTRGAGSIPKFFIGALFLAGSVFLSYFTKTKNARK